MMSPFVFIAPIMAVFIIILGSTLAFLGVKLCAKLTGDTEDQTRTFLRVVVSVVVFTAIFYGAGLVLGGASYDLYVEGIKYLAAVIGAGCYWIGSRK